MRVQAARRLRRRGRAITGATASGFLPTLAGLLALLPMPLAFAQRPTAASPPLTRDEAGVASWGKRDWLQEDASLRDLCFIDADRGWASGDRGVILTTRNGGDQWTLQPTPTGATLNAIEFLDAKRGVAVGGYYEPDTQLSRGVLLITSDGGATWRRRQADLPLLRDVILDADGTMLVTGDFSIVHGGAVLSSADQGRTWTATATEGIERGQRLMTDPSGAVTVVATDGTTNRLPNLLASTATVGGAARPRRPTVIDPTGQRRTLPAERLKGLKNVFPAAVHRVLIFDQQRAWAVGAFGTIATTRDGGQSWRRQRGGPHTAAIVFIAQHPSDLPLAAIADQSLEHGRRVALLTLEDAPPQDPLAPDPQTLLEQMAVLMGGGEARAGFPRHDAATPTQAVATAGKNWLNDYQPRVVVFGAAVPTEVRRAWIAAAQGVGATRVYEPASEKEAGWKVHRTALLPKTGAILADVARDAAALAGLRLTPGGDPTFRRIVDEAAPLGRALQDPLEGFFTAERSDCRTVPNKGSRRSLQVLQARTREATILKQMLDQGDRYGSFQTRLRLALQQTSKENRVRLARQVIDGCRRTNQVSLEQLAWEVVEPLIPEAPLTRLLELRARRRERSLEWQHLMDTAWQPSVEKPAALSDVRISPFPRESIQPAAALTANTAGQSPVQQAVSVEELVIAPDLRSAPTEVRPRGAGGPVLAWDLDPRVLYIARETDSTTDPATGSKSMLRRFRGLTGWQPFFASVSESKLGRQAAPVKTSHRITAVLPTKQRPLLDAELNDSVWAETDHWDTPEGYRVRVAYDAEFLFFAITGPALESSHGTVHRVETAASQEGRQRDSPLDDSPRLVLKFDTDRDLATAFGLEIAPDGRTRDTIDGYAGWQPEWFVDSDVHADRWVIEGALRRRDLGSEGSVPRNAFWNFQAAIIPAGQSAWPLRLPRADHWQPLHLQ